MRELFAFIRAEIELGLIKLKIKIDRWTTNNDPHLGEWPGDGFDETGGAELAEVEKFLDDVRGVEAAAQVQQDEITEYITGTLGIELMDWQRNLIGVVYGPQTTGGEK